MRNGLFAILGAQRSHALQYTHSLVESLYHQAKNMFSTLESSLQPLAVQQHAEPHAEPHAVLLAIVYYLLFSDPIFKLAG